MELHTRDSLAAIHGIHDPRPRRTRRRHSPFHLLRVALAAWARRRTFARLVRRLERRDDRLLRDIGIERHQIAAWVKGARAAFDARPPEPEHRT